jgi:hypothetical protein
MGRRKPGQGEKPIEVCSSIEYRRESRSAIGIGSAELREQQTKDVDLGWTEPPRLKTIPQRALRPPRTGRKERLEDSVEPGPFARSADNHARDRLADDGWPVEPDGRDRARGVDRLGRRDHKPLTSQGPEELVENADERVPFRRHG